MEHTNECEQMCFELEYSEILAIVTDVRCAVVSKILEYGTSDNLELTNKFLRLLSQVIVHETYDDLEKWGIICRLAQEYAPKSKQMFKSLRYRKINGVPEKIQQENTVALRTKFRSLFVKLHALIIDKRKLEMLEKSSPQTISL